MVARVHNFSLGLTCRFCQRYSIATLISDTETYVEYQFQPNQSNHGRGCSNVAAQPRQRRLSYFNRTSISIIHQASRDAPLTLNYHTALTSFTNDARSFWLLSWRLHLRLHPHQRCNPCPRLQSWFICGVPASYPRAVGPRSCAP